ncbi:GDP-fucose protein O-fucosyltransferase 2-like [Physella acuta]|uniref:GDP-fucose protein O-fucosyltransferase 2-like n=1 Tax=Physella acuta TaxID=109671 RepID=UPI0027DB5D31|nr:GDP-fucose protein O-fucosyltransferase 2-like [Physella acuta]
MDLKTIYLTLLVFNQLFYLLNAHVSSGEDYDSSFSSDKNLKLVVDSAKSPRYLLYEVNPGEGFNLRRDVYMRVAVLVKALNEVSPWILVLPPWSHIYHWKSRDIGSQEKMPWSTFFDIASLRRFVPVMEFDEFLKISKEPIIDELYYLQHYKEGWETWEEKMDKRPCINNPYFLDEASKLWHGWFFGYDEKVAARTLECVSVMGHATYLKPFLLYNTTGRSVMIDRAETVLHDRYGDALFWQVRRSMRFSKHLRDIGDVFRMDYLNSTDEQDLTRLEENWMDMKRKHGDAIGGPYLAVHLRRADFVLVREKDVPSLKHAATQIIKLLNDLALSKVFIATDAPVQEYNELKGYLKDYQVYRYQPSMENRLKYKDGGAAIVDQWICAHARYFIGTKESTFSFRIQDEREILGFKPETTFNRLCHENDKVCEQPSKWMIQYP